MTHSAKGEIGVTLFSEEKICFWVITVNLTRHWERGNKRDARTIT